MSSTKAIFACNCQVSCNKYKLESKGLAICSQPGDKYAVVLFDSVSQLQEFSVQITEGTSFDIINEFSFALQPLVSVTLKSSEDFDNFMRQVLILRNYMQEVGYQNGGTRKMLMQDVFLGNLDSDLLLVGDAVKIKYTIFEIIPEHFSKISNALRRIIALPVSNDSNAGVKVTIGLSSGEVLPIIEQSLMGMHKKGRRIVVLSPELWESADWSPHISRNAHLLIETSIVSVKYCKPSDLNRKDSVFDNEAEKREIVYKKPVEKPSTKFDSQLASLFSELDMLEYADIFSLENISFNDLKLLNEDDLTKLVPKLGPRKRLMIELANNSKVKTETETIKLLASQSSGISALDSIPQDKAVAYGKAEYQRGLMEAVEAGKTKIGKITEQAREKIEELEETIRKLKEQYSSDEKKLLKQKIIIDDLNKKLQISENDKEEIVSRSKEYVGRIRAASQEYVNDGFQSLLNYIYNEFSSVISSDKIYDGEQVLKHLKQKMKHTMSEYNENQELFMSKIRN